MAWMLQWLLKFGGMSETVKAASGVAAGGGISLLILMGLIEASEKRTEDKISKENSRIVQIQSAHNEILYSELNDIKNTQRDGFRETNKRLDKLFELQIQRGK